MKFYNLFLALISLNLFTIKAQTETENLTPLQFLDLSDNSFTIGYWNDNFSLPQEMNNLFKRKIFQTADDFVTASFWLRYSAMYKNQKWFLDSYLNVLTSRENKYRTDLFSIRLMREQNLEFGFLRYGIGIVLGGNYGGEFIQKNYHKIFFLSKVELPYQEKNYFGISFYTSIRPIIYESNHFRLMGVGSLSYLTAGPSFMHTGVSFVCLPFPTRWILRFHIGGEYYYQNKPLYTPFFDEGLLWGFISSYRIMSNFQISSWVTGNQYGTGSQNHFGISFTFGAEKLIMISIDDVKYP